MFITFYYCICCLFLNCLGVFNLDPAGGRIELRMNFDVARRIFHWTHGTSLDIEHHLGWSLGSNAQLVSATAPRPLPLPMSMICRQPWSQRSPRESPAGSWQRSDNVPDPMTKAFLQPPRAHAENAENVASLARPTDEWNHKSWQMPWDS